MRTSAFDLRQGSGHGVSTIEPSGRSANTDRHEEMERGWRREKKPIWDGNDGRGYPHGGAGLERHGGAGD